MLALRVGRRAIRMVAAPGCSAASQARQARHVSKSSQPQAHAAKFKLDVERQHYVENYPFSKRNVLFNICQQGEKHVVARFGKFHRLQDAGWYFSIPLIDRITRHDMREITVAIAPQSGVTRDNVCADVSGVLFVRVVDPVKASYGAQQPLNAIVKAAEAAMRNALGSMDLDECFRGKDALNHLVLTALRDATEPWGVICTRYEVTEVSVPPEIQKAMNLQAAAERQRRETCLGAQAEADVIRQLAAANRNKDQEESMGQKTRTINVAEGNARAMELDAEARRFAQVKNAEGQAQALDAVSKALSTKEGTEAAKLALAHAYVQAIESMGKSSNTIFMPENVLNLSGMLAKATYILDTLKLTSPSQASAQEN